MLRSSILAGVILSAAVLALVPACTTKSNSTTETSAGSSGENINPPEGTPANIESPAPGSAEGTTPADAPAGSASPDDSGEAAGKTYTTESAKELLVRAWVIDTDHMLQSPRFDEMTPEQAQQARAMVAMIQMEMTFTDTQVTTTMGMLGQSQTETADYEIARIEGEKIILKAREANGQEDEITVTHDGERLTFQASDGYFVLRPKE